MKKHLEKHSGIWTILVSFILILILPPNLALPIESYKFERMWPTLQQPWYFDGLCGIAIDSSGNVYVANWFSDSIMQLTSDGNFITRWGSHGYGDGELRYPEGVAVDSNGYVYVVEWGNHRVQKFTPDGQFVATWGDKGSGDRQFQYPEDIAIGGSGYVYVADTSNHRIQKFTLDGQFITKWGSEGFGDGQFSNPRGIAIDIKGNVYVADTSNNRIQKFTLDGQFITKWGISGSEEGGFRLPYDIAIDSMGNVFVADKINYRIQKFTSDGAFVVMWGSSGEADNQFRSAEDLAVGPSGDVFVADGYNIRIQKFSSSGEFITKWGSTGSGNGQFNMPQGIVTDNSGNVYVVDRRGNRIQKFSSEGLFISQWGGSGSGDGEFSIPAGIAIDNDGYVYVVEWGNDRVQKFTPDGQFITKWGSEGTGDNQFDDPEGIAVNSSGNVYVADTANHRVQKFTSAGNFITKWGSFGSGDDQFDEPKGIAVDDVGNVYVADRWNDRIQKFTFEGQFIKKWGSYGSDDGEFVSPEGVFVEDSEYIYVADRGNSRIQKFTLDGDFVAKWGSEGNHPGELYNPEGVSASPGGKIYVSDTFNHRIQVFENIAITSNNKAIIVAGGGPFAGNHLWDATRMCANFAYRAFIHQGFTKESIFYLTSDTDLDLDNNGELDDVDGDATSSNLQQAIIGWASDIDNLVVYLVDHGGDSTFRTSGTETLSSSNLDAWLDQLQAVINGKVIVIYDACESGSFLTTLTPPAGKDRIVITSTSPSESAYFVTQGSVSFSNFFWTCVFNGVNVKDAFNLSRQAIGYATEYQNPLIDANGNGFGNEPEDLSLVLNVYIGNGTVIQGEVPLINEVSAPQIIVDVNSALLYANGVTDADGIARVWAVIRPPDYSAGNATNPVQELPSIDLMPVSASRFEATYGGFNIEGTYQITIYARDRIGNTSIPRLTTVSVSTPLRRKAIIVAGGPSSDELWSAVQTNAGLVYEALVFQGYSDADIYFLSPVTFSAGVDGLATLSNLNYAIGTWAAASTQDVVLYLVGRGEVQSFQMNSSENLAAAEFDTWLDSLQNSLPGNVTVIYDASHSGSVLNFLTPPPAKDRIVISSATNNQSASFILDGDISFSTFFWQQVSNGANVRDAFVHGVNAINYAAGGQTPLLDDSGNGIGNELGIDGRMARNHTIGVGIMLAGDAPVIGSVSPAQTLSGSVSALLWADDVTTAAAIERVWAVITLPGYDAGRADGGNLANIELSAAGAGRYEGTYSNFSLFGTYQIAVYTMDTNGGISLPVVTTVEQTMGADIYEADDSYLEATVIQLNGALPQRHNFHDAGDQDWVKFYAIGGEVYEVKISNVGSRADVVIELYGTDGTTLLKGPWSYGFEGESELMNWTCVTDGIYYAMVYQLIPGDYGVDTGYDLEIYRPIGPGAGWVLGMISDMVTGLPLAGVQVSTSGHGTAISLTDGAYVITDQAGTYSVIAAKSGYSSGSYTDVQVNEYGVTTCNFILAPADNDNDGISDAIENASDCLDANDDDTDDDGILDGNEDDDHNGVVDAGETDPCDEDTDDDGLQDGTEIGLSTPQGSNTDLGVFIPDADPTTQTDPLDDDTDNDGMLDGEEDADQNGQVDPGETDPNQSDSIGLPWLMLLLFGE